MKYSVLLSLGALLAVVGCKPPTTYEWGNYEGSLYTLMKDPSSLDQYGKALQRQIEDGERSGKIPPGIYAEYGYFLTVTSQPGEAIKYYEKEKQRWPESTRLMDKMILNNKAPRSAKAAPPRSTTYAAQSPSAPSAVPSSGAVAPSPAPASTATPALGKEL